jgi:trehalose 6-phosphate phosphatase
LQVFELVKLAELYYAGSHGMDIKGPAKASSRHAKAKVRADQHTSTPPTNPSRPLPTRKLKPVFVVVLVWLQAKGVLFQPASEFLPMIEQVPLSYKPNHFSIFSACMISCDIIKL